MPFDFLTSLDHLSAKLPTTFDLLGDFPPPGQCVSWIPEIVAYSVIRPIRAAENTPGAKCRREEAPAGSETKIDVSS